MYFSVRFADEMITHYGTTADSIIALENFLKKVSKNESIKVCNSFVRLERNLICDQLAAKTKSTTLRTCIKVHENRKYNNSKSIDRTETILDTELTQRTKLPRVYLRSNSDSDQDFSSEEEVNSDDSVDHKSNESVEETEMLCYVQDSSNEDMIVDEDELSKLDFKTHLLLENYLEIELKHSKTLGQIIETVKKTESDDSEMLCYVLDSSPEEMNEDELSNLYNNTHQSLVNHRIICNESVKQLIETTSLEEEIFQSSSQRTNSERISANDDEMSEDEEFNSNFHEQYSESLTTKERVEEIESNATEMLCFVLDSSPEVMNVDEDEVTNLYDKTDLPLENNHGKCNESVEQLIETTSLTCKPLSIKEEISQSDLPSIESNSEQISDHDEEVSEELNSNSSESSEDEVLYSNSCESSEDEDLNSDRSEASVDKELNSNISNPFKKTSLVICDLHVEQPTIIDSCCVFDEPSDKFNIPEDEMNEDHDISSENESVNSLLTVHQLNDVYEESTSQLSQKYDDSMDQLSDEYDEPMKEIGEEFKMSLDQQKNSEISVVSEEQLKYESAECDNSVKQIIDECKKRDCDIKKYVKYNNNKVPDYNISVIELNNNQVKEECLENYKSYLKPETKPATELLPPYDLVMSPPSHPDSTSLPQNEKTKKKGRPKGSKNRTKIVRVSPPIQERLVFHVFI